MVRNTGDTTVLGRGANSVIGSAPRPVDGVCLAVVPGNVVSFARYTTV